MRSIVLPRRRSARFWVAEFFVLGVSCLSAGAAGGYDDGAFHELESKYIFGFTVGSGVGLEGERAFEPETFARFGKRQGQYAVGQSELEYEFTPNQYVQIELGPTVSYHNISNVTGLVDRSSGGLDGFVAKFRYLFFDRPPALPLAATLSLEPEWHSRDESGGAKVVSYGLETRLEADLELVKNRLFWAANLLYTPETSRVELGAWDKESSFGVSTALSFQVVPNVVIGAELWYLRHYDGIAFNTFTGDAVYVGPTLFIRLAPKVLVSAALNTQVAGHEVGLGSQLNLTDFSHHRAKLLFEFEF